MTSWNERYATPEYYYGKEPNDFLKASVGALKPGGRVLCLAEGEGRNAVYLAAQGFHVTAVDGSSVALRKLRSLAQEKGIDPYAIVTICCDLSEYAIDPDAWDGIISIWCHVPPPLRATLHAACVAGLRPGGAFIFEAYHPNQLQHGTGGPKDLALLSTAESAASELSGLEFEILREVEREVHEGAGHNGISAVVQALAIKR